MSSKDRVFRPQYTFQPCLLKTSKPINSFQEFLKYKNKNKYFLDQLNKHPFFI